MWSVDDDENAVSLSAPSFKDPSTECAICLGPLHTLSNGDEKEEGEPVIVLSCGHEWHLACLQEQLRQAQPQPSQRLLFQGCRCAKCGNFCDHEALRDLTRSTDALRAQVDALIAEQWQLEAPHLWKDALQSQDVGAKQTLIAEGRRLFAFYLCSSCREPYFGGTVSCAEQAVRDGDDETAHPTERLCPSCRPAIQTICRHPIQHRGLHLHKCRYCCHPAQYVCYGTVHFCRACHDRNSERVRRSAAGSSPSRRPPTLESIPCPGGTSCPYPKPPDQEFHQNGPSSSCEQVYHCAGCQSLSATTSAAVQDLPAGSHNLIINPNGERGMLGWQTPRGYMSWQVESTPPSAAEGLLQFVDHPNQDDDHPNEHQLRPPPLVRTNFVSSFRTCVMMQKVPLHRFVRNVEEHGVRLEVAAYTRARSDCPALFGMEVAILDRQGRVLHREASRRVSAPADMWERVSLTIPALAGTFHVMVVLWGRDERFWAGNYGAKCTQVSLRVLGSAEELERIMSMRAALGGPGWRAWLQDNLVAPLGQSPLWMGLVLLFLAWLIQQL